MSTPQILTDEQAAAIWSGDTASLLNFDNQPDADPVDSQEPVTDPVETPKKKVVINDDDITNVWATADEEDEEDDDEPVEPAAPTQSQTPQNQAPKKSGRKPAEFVQAVNNLVEEGVLFGFEGDEEVKTIEEAKELIKENLRYKEESSGETSFEKRIQKYSPQVQAIIQYAEKGGQDITPLLSAISEVEKSADLDIDTDSGQEEIVRQVLKIKGFDEEEITDQIETLKDLDKLKTKAQKFLPELNRMKEQRIAMLMEEQEQREAQAQEAARVYIDTIQSTLDKDQVGSLKLKREDKFKIMEALAVPKYKSINGFQINEFVKALEDMQFGKNADYEHFLNIVQFAVDKEGFIERLKESLETQLASTTFKKLKTAKDNAANTTPDPNTHTSNTKNKIVRGGFRNPYAK